MEIVELRPDHWEEVRTIYLHGITTKQATFQTDAPCWEDWDKGHLSALRYIAIIDGIVAGWAALSPVSSRCVYAGVAEVSVYIHEGYRGKGVGKALLQKLITESETSDIWTLQSGIFPENLASIALHEKMGFRTIGYREKVAKMDGIWRDTMLMERRSKITGQD
ncbi:phosphinothricin acetyltransferase [Pedobacter sp. AK017]|uniref:GNAT family N-acetyltransferase n=1 Tax=Pedobacter sp. AK017 TaxID=2723073 RepID=UPI00160C14CB|nr:GNAT family N-acetyltransferase [Pedobacter sp. AK017]MBB5439181.1 phosphinothricin acetyltransferase [Pedobacter sp. AK017]